MGKSTSFGEKVRTSSCPDFGYPDGYIEAACSEPTSGPEIACGGVALQRVDCLKHGYVRSGDYYKKVGGLGAFQFLAGGQKPCRPNDLYAHFEKQGYELDWGDTKWLEGHLKRGNSPAVVLVGHQKHYVTAIGMKDGEVYWIDYGGIYRASIDKFRANASSVQPLFGNFWNCLRVFL